MAHQSDPPLWSRAPYRQLYQTYRALLLLVRLPFWAVLSAIPHTRPQRRWTFKQSLTLLVARDIVDTQARVGLTEELTLEPGRDGERFQIVEAFAPEFYRGPLMSPDVGPTKIGGVWFPASPAGGPKSGTVVLWIHGGAFVTGDGRSSTCGYVASNMLRYSRGVDAVFSVQYRLSGYGGVNPFPAALQDILTAYLYLTATLRIPASSVVVAGNSSGANAAVAFVRYVEQVAPEVGRPMCAVAISPWVIPLESLRDGYDTAALVNHQTEYVAESFHRWGATTYLPPGGLDESTSPYVTLLGNPFRTSVPILATFGEREILSPAITAWAVEMRALRGNQLELYCDEEGVHASPFVGDAMGWGDNARAISSRIGDFVQASRTASLQ